MAARAVIPALDGSKKGGFGDFIIGPAAAAEPRDIAALSLDDIRITNGAVRYSDERNGAWGRFEGINARFSLAAMHEPLTGSGSLMAEGEPFEFKSTLTTPQDLAEQRPAKLVLTVSGCQECCPQLIEAIRTLQYAWDPPLSTAITKLCSNVKMVKPYVAATVRPF